MVIHGGDIYSHDKPLIDFSANTSPLGTDERIKSAICRAAERADIYPDARCRGLRGAISRIEGIPEENIICSNGAAELIYDIVSAKRVKRALLMSPCFSEYERALRAYGADIEYYDTLEKDAFIPREDFIDCIKGDIDIIFLCSPQNPCGNVIPKGMLYRIIDKAQKEGVLVVMDECFNDFLDCPEEYSVKTRIHDNKGIMVIKAFTKMYALAGIRLGYGLCADTELLEDIYSIRQPWNVSSLAQAAGAAAARCWDIPIKTREYIAENREFLCAELDRLGIWYIKPTANFMFFKTRAGLYDELLDRGFLIRECSSYRGLGGEYYRIAVKTRRENEMLIKAIEEIIKGDIYWQGR